MTDEEVPDLAAWLREQSASTLEYARKNAARRPINPVRSHEMRELAARCEAELGILGEHRLVVADPGGPEQGQSRGGDYRIVHEHPTERDIEMAPMMWRVLHCRACRMRPPCRTVRLLGSGYRMRDGYREEWAP